MYLGAPSNTAECIYKLHQNIPCRRQEDTRIHKAYCWIYSFLDKILEDALLFP